MERSGTGITILLQAKDGIGKPVRFSVETGVAGYGNCLLVISVRAVLQDPPAHEHGALGVLRSQTRVLAASRFHHSNATRCQTRDTHFRSQRIAPADGYPLRVQLFYD